MQIWEGELMIKEYIIELGLDAVKDKIKDDQAERQVRSRLEDFVQRQRKLNVCCSREEEIDFEGLVEYLQENFLGDIKIRLFGTRKEREVARNTIIAKAITYSEANTSLSRRRVIKLIDGSIDVLGRFYKKKTNRELAFIASQIEDTVVEVGRETTQEVKLAVQSSEVSIIESVSNKIENMGALSVERNMQLLKEGNIEQVENILANFFDGIGSGHILFPDYCYEYMSENRQLYSKALTLEALKKYPPRITCTGTIQMNGKYIDRIDVNTIDYAYRHQLPITLNVITAKKLLGDIADPIQHEAESLIGEQLIIPPIPFPEANPCSISVDDEVMFDYILFRTQEILDDGTIVISNQKQENCPYKIDMQYNRKNGKSTYDVNTVNPTNKELLQYLRFLMKASSGGTISIKVLSLGEELATGKLGDVCYKTGFDKIEMEMDFLEKIVAIEDYYNDTITIPEEIMLDDFNKISYLASLIVGEECIGNWSKLEFSMTLTEELKQRLIETKDAKFSLSYVGSVTMCFYGKSYELSAIRSFDCVVYQDIEKLKKKAEVLDVGDSIKLTFLPGDGESGTWHDRLNNDDNEYSSPPRCQNGAKNSE